MALDLLDGQNGNYLFELAAQPGGPAGRPLTTAGSKPISILGRPQGVWPCSSGLVTQFLHLVPSPVDLSKSHSPSLVNRLGLLAAPGENAALLHHARYDAFGQLAAEYNGSSWSRDYIRLGGGPLIASENASATICATCYFSYDHLGSVRLVTDQNGSVVARHDYLPFGEEISAGIDGRSSQFGQTADVAQKFTGQIRDRNPVWIISMRATSHRCWGGSIVRIQ